MCVFGVILVNHAIQFVQSNELAFNTTDELFDDHDAETDDSADNYIVKRLNCKKPNSGAYRVDNRSDVDSFKNCYKKHLPFSLLKIIG